MRIEDKQEITMLASEFFQIAAKKMGISGKVQYLSIGGNDVNVDDIVRITVADTVRHEGADNGGA